MILPPKVVVNAQNFVLNVKEKKNVLHALQENMEKNAT
jgi:hypothetical protein